MATRYRGLANTILDDEGEKYLHDFFMHPAPGSAAPVPFH